MRTAVQPDSAPHVLMTADAVGGVWTYALDLSEALIAAGVRVTLAVLGPVPSPAQRRQASEIAGLSQVGVDGPLDWTADSAAELRPVAEALVRLAAERRVDLVHLNSPALAALADFGRPVLGVCHSCTASWWEAVRGDALAADFVWRRDLLARGYRACDALVAPTDAFAGTTERLYGVRPHRAWNGRRAALAGAGHKPEHFVLTAGRLWDEGKDLLTLDRLAGRLTYPVVALGGLTAPDGACLALQHVRTPGPQSANMVADWMAAAPVFVSTAVYEPFGLAVLEAAQAGAALVLSDIPTFRELWQDAAVFAPSRDADGFAKAVSWLLSNADERERLADAAQARAARYTVDAMADAVLERYATLTPAFASVRPSRRPFGAPQDDEGGGLHDFRDQGGAPYRLSHAEEGWRSEPVPQHAPAQEAAA